MASPLIEALLATPIDPVTPSARVVNKEERKASTQALWEAVDANDIEGVQRALEQEASLTAKRNGQGVLYRAVNLGHWDIAQVLVDSGANVQAKTASHQSLGHAIAERDDVEEAEKLVQLGCNHAQWHFKDIFQSPNLLVWWINQGHGNDIPHPDTGAYQIKKEVQDLMDLAASGPNEALMDALDEAWADGENFKFSNSALFHDEFAEDFIKRLYKKDDVHAVARCIKKGWHPHFDDEIDVAGEMWQQYHCKADRVLSWFCKVPNFQNAMRERAPALMSLWCVRAGENVGRLKRALELGGSFEMCDTKGNNLAHYIFKRYSETERGEDDVFQPYKSLDKELNDDTPAKMSRQLLGFLMKHATKALSQPNHKGETPLSYWGAERAAEVEAEMLQMGLLQKPQAPSRGMRL